MSLQMLPSHYTHSMVVSSAFSLLTEILLQCFSLTCGISFFFHTHTGPFGQTSANSKYNAEIIATGELMISHSIFIRFTWFLDLYEAFIAPEMICTSSTQNNRYFNFLGKYIYILNYLNFKNRSWDWLGGNLRNAKGVYAEMHCKLFPMQTPPNMSQCLAMAMSTATTTFLVL